ncbi:hypothetical protein EB001_21335 [bacterium]|nr:hypothetical protein [bacterium]
MIYYYPEFYLNQRSLFPPLSFLNTILSTREQIRNNPFLIMYGIQPIYVYILKKYSQDRTSQISSVILSQIDREFQTLYQTLQGIIQEQGSQNTASDLTATALTPTLPQRPKRNPKQVPSAKEHSNERLKFFKTTQKQQRNKKVAEHRTAAVSNFDAAAARGRERNRAKQEEQLQVGRGKRNNKTKKRSKSKSS